jgi:hypothetical protein
MLIACQNDTRAAGQKSLPINVTKGLRIFEYTMPSQVDVEIYCNEILDHEFLFESRLQSGSIIPKQIASFMCELNQLSISQIEPWSMRDLRKLFNRISHSEQNPESYINFSILCLFFYLVMSQVPPEHQDDIFEKIIQLLGAHFQSLFLKPRSLKILWKILFANSFKSDLLEIIQDSKQNRIIPATFIPVLENLLSKITDPIPSIEDSNGFGDFTTVV